MRQPAYLGKENGFNKTEFFPPLVSKPVCWKELKHTILVVHWAWAKDILPRSFILSAKYLILRT